MYLDAVLSRDYVPIFNGTREDTISFLVARKDDQLLNSWTVVPGETLELMNVDDYMVRYASNELNRIADATKGNFS